MMNPIYILLLSSCLIVLVLDVISSIASRRFNFNYARLAPLSFIIYATVGFLGTREADQIAGIVLSALVGFFDATIGWKTSIVLKANTGNLNNNPSISRWVSTAVFVTLFAAICGLIGSELARLVR
ncbi:MAG TPA: hypothetical protein VGI43_17885 [Mucilaginibacter sp.]|jgi:hypothetical protein